jgi:hypothetical protein
MNQSAQAFQTFRSMMPQQQSVGSMFLSPAARINLAQSERNMQYQRDLAAAQEAAKADPVTKGLVDVGVKIASAAMGAGFGGDMGTSLASAGGSGIGTGGSSFMTSLKGFGTRAKGFFGIAPSSTVAGPAWMQSSYAPGSAPGFTPMAGMPGF